MNKRQYYLDYLRAGLIFLIVIEHISIAYTSLATLHAEQCYFSDWLFVANSQSEDSWVILRSFRISFAIPLLFFISGIFVPPGIKKHGVKRYFYCRLQRIGIPLLFMAIILAPLTYYLPCKVINPSMNFHEFLNTEFNIRLWRIGPGWFLWTLLVFDCLACFCSSLVSNFFEKTQRLGSLIVQHPKLALAAVIFSTYLGYFSGALLIENLSVTFWQMITGPFIFIAKDIFVDTLFFILGILLSSHLLNPKQNIVKSPWIWVFTSSIIFIVQLNLPLSAQHSMLTLTNHPILAINLITTPLLAVLLSISLLSLFQHYFNRYNQVAQIISTPSFAIYIFHFPICLWLQFYMQQLQLSVANKIVLIFLTTISFIMIGYYLARYFNKKITTTT